MKSSPETYKYMKQVGGHGQFGMVKLSVSKTDHDSFVEDNCSNEQEHHKDGFLSGSEVAHYKEAVIDSANLIIKHGLVPKNSKITIYGLWCLIIDTSPAHLASATLIGVLDQIGQPLSESNIEKLKLYNASSKSIKKVLQMENWL